MCHLALDFDTLPAHVLQSALPGLHALDADGLVRLFGGRLTISDETGAFIPHAAACSDARLAAGMARHSAAV